MGRIDGADAALPGGLHVDAVGEPVFLQLANDLEVGAPSMTSALIIGEPWDTTTQSTSPTCSISWLIASGSSFGPNAIPPSICSHSQSAIEESRSRSAGGRLSSRTRWLHTISTL